MLLAIIGTRSSGKTMVEDYYIHQQKFTSVHLVGSNSESHRLQHKVNSLSLSEVDRGTFTHAYNEDGRLSFLSMGNGALPTPLLSPNPGRRTTNQQQLYFSTAGQLLEYVTKHWQLNFVTRDLRTRENIQLFVKRPFFFLVSLDGPLLQRFRRYKSSSRISLERFVIENDTLIHGFDPTFRNTTDKDGSTLQALEEMVDVKIINRFETLSLLHAHLDDLNLTDSGKMRPSWDSYFMTFASLASKRSNCMKRRVGAILVQDNRIVATGYNGTPRGLTNCNEGGCARCNGTIPNSDTSFECICLHAEENALLEAGRARIGRDTILYCNTCPCLKCTVKIIQTGVKEVVYDLSYKVDDASAKLFEEAGVKLRRYPDPAS